jgi:tetratricopeptide (TPR) repeat protein
MAVGVLVLLGAVVYFNSFAGSLHFDDRTVITENASIRPGAGWSALLSPPAASGASGRPVANLSFALNYRLSGLELWSYHALNLALHIAAAGLLLGLVRRTLRLPAAGGRDERNSAGLALAIAALWLVHPVQTGVVTYLSQRTEALLGFFYLLTLYAFVRATSTPGRVWPVVTVAACALGMVSKQSMVTAPLVVLLYDRTFVSGTFRAAWRRHWRLHLGLMTGWLVLAACATQLEAQSVGYGLGVTWLDYALTEARALCLYLKLLFYPAPLVFDYGPSFLHTAREAAPYIAVVALALGTTLWGLRRRPALGFLGAWFFLMLAPTSSVVPVALQPVAENRLYLPVASAMVAVVLAADRWLGRRGRWGVLVAIIGLWAGLSIARNRTYRDEVTLWSDTIVKAPGNARAHYNLGLALHDTRGPEAARASYERAIALQPDYADAYCNLGHALTELGRPQEAVPPLERALQLRPDHAESLLNLGNAWLALGRWIEAAERFGSALRSDPANATLHNNLAFALLKLGRLTEATTHFSEAVRLQPGRADWHFNLSIALSAAGRNAEAVAACEQALKLDPQHAKAREKLARLRGGL